MRVLTNKRPVLPEALHPADPPGDPRSPLARLVTTLLLLKSLRILNCSEAGCLLEIKSKSKSSGSKKDQREVETLHFFCWLKGKTVKLSDYFCWLQFKAVIPMSPRLN